MSSYNKVILIGRVTAQPEMRYTQTGKAVATFTVAVDRAKKADGKEKETDFISVVAWQKLAEICSQYLDKGKLICVDGRLQTRSYTTNDGQKRKVYEVVAADMRMLGSRSSERSGPSHDEMPPVDEGGKEYDSLGIQDIGMEDDVPF
jgi:single-strand DNA-binding protein